MQKRDPRYDILFEEVQIGPKKTRNRFYQVPHCNGMGHRYPRAMAEMRGVKAEGGWGVVNTEECSIHPSSDLSPFTLMRLWDDSDLPVHELMVQKVHEHGSLAGIQLVHNGLSVANYYSRLPPLAPSNTPTESFAHVQARGMDKADIREFREWHVGAAKRASRAGYDIVYAYAAHGTMTLLNQFLLRRFNQRTDEYGGSLQNRIRLVSEVLSDAKDAVGHKCAIAFRFAVEEFIGEEGMTLSEAEDAVGLLAELPDLWDVNVADWKNDSLPSRFGQEGFQEEYIRFVKKVTTKPVVGVGRFTSPDTMVRQIKSGVMDLIGAARPSIADPFLPYKIDNGLVDEIRECIGCNMCTSGDTLATPMRCTQNPTMGEEWRSGWHPMRIDKRHANEKVLVVGAGPAGLEATLALSNRGYDVTLSEAGEELGGRVLRESSLPSLREWRRVADHRAHMLASRAGVEIFTQSHLSVEDVLSVGCEHVAIATGSRWRDDLIGREHRTRPNIDPQCRIITPDDIMAGERPRGRVLIFDDDHYYMANVIAELLVAEGCAVTFVTPAADISTWSHNTLEHEHVKTRLLRSGVKLACNRMIREVKLGGVVLECPYTGNKEQIETDAFIAVTSRIPEDGLYRQLLANADRWQETGLKSLTAIGDCYAPATIAISVQAGHRYARELGSGEGIGVLRREVSFGGE
ncbi:FAD-dependent oxidoreductase [Mesorhizobium sp.]|uniref:oxidoreductase n=1 Tax=Mesorhizobium sp. TaxID=1871066 RepID=UPI000FE86048|nr:FAD-dependent oxidoreductase [Mesorhizobium sp.]RWG00855.1 MAG: FAD-binding protein [Mesorhizobium sp.]RWG96586.1 MAG: FAD-binding protein [Mesorhizobium sp.]RWI16747.1 MAG: FAD-binding protein [Mesorhizobium sp.]RWN08762.1 MAG: FAD-binding protein [Mesorhizobium sp.]RWN16187.1 MAG: FAD-binding protein [Mesorhizobium sp.]